MVLKRKKVLKMTEMKEVGKEEFAINCRGRDEEGRI